MRKVIILSAITFLGLFLRVYHLSANPPSLSWDEASLGYNAFAVSQTLRDEHGEFLPLSRFIAFGDYKPPGYIYAAVPFIKILGLTELAVRLPSALAGTALILVAFFLALEIWRQIKLPGQELKYGSIFALLAALFVAVSPWSLQMSRAAFEANLATVFSASGIYFLLEGLRTRRYVSLAWSSILLVLAMYTFNAHRLFIPLFVGLVCVIYLKKNLHNWRQILFFALLLLLLNLPQLSFLLSREGKLRFNEVSWINDISITERSNTWIAGDGGDLPSRILHNRRILFLGEFAKHLTDHFQPSYLFFTGDVNPRLSTERAGLLYLAELPLLLVGFYFLVGSFGKMKYVLAAWLFTGLVPASLARETPHALRSLNLLPLPQIISALGASLLFTKIASSRRLIMIFPALVLSLSLIAYLFDYHFVYPREFAPEWQYGYKQAVASVAELESNYDEVRVTNKYGRPYIYFLFYLKTDPRDYLATRVASRDWYGFWTVSALAKYRFTDEISSGGKILYLAGPETPPGARVLRRIMAPDGETLFTVFDRQ